MSKKRLKQSDLAWSLRTTSHQLYQSHQQHQQRVAAVAGETNVMQTASLSDNGVGEHEAILDEKDAEINTLQ
ncbi:hypothetical protein RRG08_024042 [Elysia crispata]|uniref:Uncharacterized protein n=1 Tax=Elysia crispata TaxID=231223 RepID=A0AAE0ZQN4_9GAST|nr:hypothetical protein RRG08_024042 [Elysia crispata]